MIATDLISFLPWYGFAFLYGLIVSAIPGPVIILASQYALRKNMKQVFLCLLGLFLADIIYLALILIGYHTYLIENVYLLNFIATIGAIYIIILGLRGFFLKNSKFSLTKNYFLSNNFIKCFLISITNPGILFIFLVALKPYSDYYSHEINLLLYFLLIEVASIFYYCLLIFWLYHAKGLQTQKGLNIIDKIAGSLLIVIGILLLFSTYS